MQCTTVALTRELGANDKLSKLLEKTPEIKCIEIPCIQFEVGPGAAKLEEEGFMKSFDVITITSPQAAFVFAEGWKKAGKPNDFKVVTVGKGTSKALESHGIESSFEPSDSTAVTLAKELPDGWGKKVLYPSSALADNKLVAGLQDRGFKVTRLDTYNTVPAQWTEEQLALARSVDIVTFASPSAVKLWGRKVGDIENGKKSIAVVIGPTSENACLATGLWTPQQVIAPALGASKGVGPWAKLVKTVVNDLHNR